MFAQLKHEFQPLIWLFSRQQYKFDVKNFLWDKLNQNWFTDSKIKNSSNFMDFFWDQSEYVIEWKYWLACYKYVCIYLYNMVRKSLQYIVPILRNRCLGVVYVWYSLLQLTVVTRDLSQAEQIHSFFSKKTTFHIQCPRTTLSENSSFCEFSICLACNSLK